jgi:cyclic pyranopterin phosphate synthase
MAARILGVWTERRDRGAEERLGLTERGSLAPPSRLRADPHLEMHTRGG